jgi:hypothetical protein
MVVTGRFRTVETTPNTACNPLKTLMPASSVFQGQAPAFLDSSHYLQLLQLCFNNVGMAGIIGSFPMGRHRNGAFDFIRFHL